MSLQVWLPLNGNLNNQGLSEITSTGGEVNNEGILGKCYACSSSSYVTIQNPITDKYNFSFSFWMKMPTTLSSAGAWSTIFLFRCLNINNNSTETSVGISWTDYNNIKIYDEANHQNIWMSPGDQFNYDKWCHYTITHTGNDSSTTIKVYTDGILRGTFNNSHRLVLRSGNILLGSGINPSYGPIYFNDFRLYDHCLSAKEVKEISKGLSLHYKLSDPYIESTTNLYGGWSSYCYNASKDVYGYGTSTDMYFDTLEDSIIKVRMGTAGSSAYPYVYFDGLADISPGSYKTLSFDYYPTIMDKVEFYSWNTSGELNYTVNGISGTGGTIPVRVSNWNHISITIKNTGSASSGFGYMKIGLEEHTSNTSNYWLFKNIQVEDKDHPTPFVVGSRDESMVYDCSGIANNGTKIGGVLPSSNPLPIRYEKSYDFDGSTGSIQIPNLATLVPSGEFTMNCWIYHDNTWSSEGYETIFGGPSGFELDAKYGSTNSPVLWALSWGGGQATYELNKWNMITMTRNASEAKFYINGELKITGSAGTIPSGNYFIGAWKTSNEQNFKGKISDFRLYSTVLSADDIRMLYDTSASIDKNGNMYAYEFKEE